MIYIFSIHFYIFFNISNDDFKLYLERSELIRYSETEYKTGLLIIDNLLRLRLIEEQPPKLKDSSKQTYFYSSNEEVPENEIISTDCFRLSKFGTEFLNQIMR